MAAVVSSEFVSLCQGQLRSLTQQMADASAAVYIADVADTRTVQRTAFYDDPAQTRQEPNFVPVVSYPQTLDSWVQTFERRPAWAGRGPIALPGSVESGSVESGSVESGSVESNLGASGTSEDSAAWLPAADSKTSARDWAEILHPDQQLVVPLVYADVVVGLIVAIRRDRPWLSEERHQVEGMAQSLAAGCVLERRNQWLQGQMASKRELQSRQSEIFHNLLHQFRNPLTAVTTFGQLLVRRLEPEDPNQKVATGIVRESKRLREMVAHFDETVAIGDADLEAETTAPGDSQLLLSGSPQTPPQLPAAKSPVTLSEATASEVTESSQINEMFKTDEDVTSVAGLGHALTLSAQYLPDIVEPIVAVAGIVATEKGVMLQAQVASDTPSVWGEEEALREIVSNLVDNAVKYSPAGAHVFVQTGVSRIEDKVQYQGIVVGDTGPGIPASDLAQLFERNYRGVQADGEIPGTGLGLAIAQSLTHEMQGFIEVISPAVDTPWMPVPRALAPSPAVVGPGSVFIVWLLEIER
ncbi:MAG: GAF domain-containing sensor histidine kinase [Cyanobacteria bacterium J06554_3]